MKNEYLILYAVADMTAHHFLTNDIAELDKDKNIFFKKSPRKIGKSNFKMYQVLLEITNILNKKLSREGFNGVKKKYNSLLQGFKNNKQFNEGYAPILIAVSLLSEYARVTEKKMFKIHPKSVEKIMVDIKKEAELKYLDDFVLNSLVLGEKIYKEMVK